MSRERVPVRILVLDDEPSNLEALAAILEPLGEELVVVRSGEEALWEVARGDFGLVLLDVRLPTMSGLEVAGVLRSRPSTRGIPLIFLTAYPEAVESVHQAYRLGAADVIFKPIDPEVLRTKVRVFVELHRQQQTIQALLEEAESANRAKTAFLRMASHELRSPIAIALGYLSLLEDGTIAKPPEAWGRPLELVKAKVTQVARMANDMLEVARLEGGAIQPQAEAVNVAELAAREVGKLTSLAEQMSFSVTVSASPSSVWARADERHVARILEHLVQNALTYCRESRAVLVHTYEQGETVVIDVADKGIGIPPDLRERIFDPFFRVDDPSLQARPGTGLGLCIGRGLAECNGGHLVAATPEPGWQSCLRLTLPRSPALERIDVVNGNERGQHGATDKVPGHASVAAAKGWG